MLCFLEKSSHLFVDDPTCTKRARVVFSLSRPESKVGKQSGEEVLNSS